MTKQEKQLVEIFQQLSKQDRQSVISFAQFLQQQAKGEDEEEISDTPLGIERPKEEKVVAAIKRLSANYSMINKSGVLDEAANLMTQHMLHGRDAKEVIDELETVFLNHYEKYLAEK